MWNVVRRLERDDPTQMSAEQIERARERRRLLIRLPIAWIITGRPNPRVRANDEKAELADGTELPVRIYRPRAQSAAPRAVVVYFHGGGFMTGDPRQSEWWSSNVAARADVVVVSVDYRLAPAHPFPAAAEDSYAATCWVAEHAAELGVDPARLAVMGDSAGGNLAAVVSLLARDRGGPQIRLQALIYPVVDLVGSYPSEDENADAPVLTKRDMDRFHGTYLAGADGKDLRASPLLASDHSGLPPALIETAQFDPLRDQGYAYAAALEAAGVRVRHVNRERSVHGFTSIPGIDPTAHEALRDVVDELRRAL
jgi:acetyl esterase